jgi:hypothetical protein
MAASLPSRLDALAQRLPRAFEITGEDLLIEGTLWPIYGLFLPQDRQRFVRDSLLDTRGRRDRLSAEGSLQMLNANRLAWLRWCPRCAQEEREDPAIGEPYWHRAHQVVDVPVCHKHGVVLHESTVRTHFEGSVQFVTAADALRHVPISREMVEGLPNLCSRSQMQLKNLVEDVAWLLERWLAVNLGEVRTRYRTLLRRSELLRGWKDRQIKWEALCRSFSAVYADDLLQMLGCELPPTARRSWLTVALGQTTPLNRPLQHLLIFRWLGAASVDDFFAQPPHTPPFGLARWPCLNPVAEHYREPVVEICQVRSTGGRDYARGRFSCAYGYVYTRRGLIRVRQIAIARGRC